MLHKNNTMARLYKRRFIYVPTVFGWLLIICILITGAYLSLRHTYSFLAASKPAKSKILVLEGWIDDKCVQHAIDFYRKNGYEYLVVTGVPITQWTYSSPFSNMADATAGSIRRMYFKDSIYKAIVPSAVLRDRTYSTAVALKMNMEKWNFPYKDFDLYTVGAHSRRSYLVYKKAFNDGRYIGLIADTDPSFEPEDWYRTSRGFRIVISELISYFYSLLFFHPDEAEFRKLITNGFYLDKIQQVRLDTDNEFADIRQSPLDSANVADFRGLVYYPIDPAYRVKATFTVDTTSPPFEMQTSKTRRPMYRKYGLIKFMLRDTSFVLAAYQNLDYLKAHPDYKELFVPFKDKTNGKTTYGAGRYLDIPIPAADSVNIDFNLAYNPYCAYAERWSCPLTPIENYLETRIEAGVLKYH